MSMAQLMAGYAEHYRRKGLTPAQRAAEDKAKADKAARERSSVTESWQDLYNTGGDKAVAEYIKSNYKSGEAGWKQSDYNHANQFLSSGTSFNDSAKADYDKAYADWNKFVSIHNEKIGVAQQTLREIYPWEKDSRKAGLSNYDNFNFSGWVDPQIQIDKDNSARELAEKNAKAEADRKAAAAAKQQEEQQLSSTTDQKNQSVQNAFYGSNNTINQGPNKNREEAVDRAQEYQKNSNITTEVGESQKYQNNSSNQAVNNTEKSTTKSNSWNNDGFVQSLADEKLDEYKAKWRGDGQTNNYSNVFKNNINQNIGNKGNTTTNIGNSNKFNNVRAGNDYSLNFGNIDLNNSSNS